MLVLRNIAELRAWRATVDRVALVPTMGFLHDGHLALLSEGRRRIPEGNGAVALSIFVNPTQFTDPRDLESYPRDEAGDLAKAASVGTDVAFCPSDANELYPDGASTWIDVDHLGRHLCGATRPGHFRGVCTIVGKLLVLFRPEFAIFGEKDYQQLTIVRRMHRDLLFGGQIVGLATIREADGLAMSSRNARLSPEGRLQSLAIPRFLAQVRDRFAAGLRETNELLAGAEASLVPGHVEYVSLVGAEDLQPIERVDRPALLAVAVVVGGVRLIDNTVLAP